MWGLGVVEVGRTSGAGVRPCKLDGGGEGEGMSQQPPEPYAWGRLRATWRLDHPLSTCRGMFSFLGPSSDQSYILRYSSVSRELLLKAVN